MILRSKFFILSLLAGVFLAAHSGAAETLETPDGITEPLNVTFEELVKNPEYYQGKKVRVRGFLSLEFARNGLFSSLEKFLFYKIGEFPFVYEKDLIGIAYDTMVDEYGDDYLSLNIPQPWIKYQRTYVEIEATFDGQCLLGYVCIDGFGASELSNITSIKIIERPHISSLLYKYITGYSLIVEGMPPDFILVSEDDNVYASFEKFMNDWVTWVKTENFGELKRTISKKWDEEQEWKNLDKPEHFIYQQLFSQDLLAQKAVSQYPESKWVLSKTNPDSDFVKSDGEMSFYLGCICLDGSCEKLWPVNFKQVISPSLEDEFWCLTLEKRENGWEWGG